MSEQIIDWIELPSKVVLFNPEKKVKGGGSDVKEYPISEVELDKNDEVVLDRHTGRPKLTDKVNLWSINAGERARFPKYVAQILCDRYQFLKVELEDENRPEAAKAEETAPKQAGADACRFCGATFGNRKVLINHIAEQHPEAFDAKE